MLNQQQIDIIKATAPVVGEHARQITECFYPLMFERYPEVQAYFNQAHQQKGTQRQALANALVAYATHIDQLEKLGDAVSLIAHKHCSLNILPEHYPIVGECLMEAIGIVLGDAVTAEIADAWQTAYQQLANLLIQVEEEIYQNNSKRQGGWRGERLFSVEKIVSESDVIKSFYLIPCEGERIIDFTPGQYIGLITNIDGKSIRRNYSLSDAPGKEGLRISVKHEQDGVVSGYLHNTVKVGDTLTLTAPTGDFVLNTENQDNKPVVMISGGVGITPVMSMLNSYVSSGNPVTFIHAAINGDHQAFNQHLGDLSKQHDNLETFIVHEKPLATDKPDATGFITKSMLEPLLPADRDVELYFLGPKPFMQCINSLAQELNIPVDQQHYEFFGPAEELAQAS